MFWTADKTFIFLPTFSDSTYLTCFHDNYLHDNQIENLGKIAIITIIRPYQKYSKSSVAPSVSLD